MGALRFSSQAEFDACQNSIKGFKAGVKIAGVVKAIESSGVKPCFSPGRSTDEQKLNKTETRRLNYLRALKVESLRFHAITLKLADDCRLTVDFTYVEGGRMVFEDVKGFQREDALIKMKMAARLFSEFRFVIVKEQGVGMGWEVKEVNP
jgi:hypothetical protein